MIALLVVIHVVVCVILIFIVLLQSGKGAEMGAAFGGASQTVFGSSGPTDFMGKLTTWSAALFMVTSLTLAYLSSGKSTPSVVDKVPMVPAQQQAQEGPMIPQGLDQVLPPEGSGDIPASPVVPQEAPPSSESDTTE